MRGAPDPEAVASEVFLHVFTNLNKFSGAEEQFNGWVFRIARNQLIDGHRRQQRRVIEVGGQISETSQAVDDVESIAIANVELDSIVAVLHQLSSDQQDVVMLRIVADLTLEATANVMGKRIGAVKALQRRAFKKLSKILFLKSVTL